MEPEPKWWPEPENWPAMLDEESRNLWEALALLILEEVVVTAAPAKGARAATLYVNCSDLFSWGTADVEPLPCIGFGDPEEAVFWDLYRRVRESGVYGGSVWCCLQRKEQPFPQIVSRWKAEGRWTPELEALPKNRHDRSLSGPK